MDEAGALIKPSTIRISRPTTDRSSGNRRMRQSRSISKTCPDGIFLPPVPLKCSDVLVQNGAAKLGVKGDAHRSKIDLSRPSSGRPACHFCGNCMAGCDVSRQIRTRRMST